MGFELGRAARKHGALLHFISPKNFYITKKLLYHQSAFISPIKLLYHQTIFTKKFVALNKIFFTEFMVIRNNWAHTFKGAASGSGGTLPLRKIF